MRLVWSVLALSLAMGCQRGGGNGEAAGDAERAEFFAHCATGWRLVRWTEDGTDVPMPKDAHATLRCDADGLVTGSSFLNTFTFRRRDGGSKLFASGSATLLAGPAELMTAEDRFIAAMQRMEDVSATKRRLELSSKDGQIRLEFVSSSGP